MAVLKPEGSVAVVGGVTIPIPSGRRSDVERFQWGSLLLVLPALVLLIALFIGPAIYAFYLGFTNLALLGPTAEVSRFTGTANLERLLHDPTFFASLATTAEFVGGSIVGAITLGMILAIAQRSANRAVAVMAGAVAVVAWMMPAISAGLAWYATTAAGGVVATATGAPNSDVVASAPLTIVTVANVWSQTGFIMLAFGAALRNLPSEMLEAATLEGANAWQRFRKVTLPLIWPTVVTMVLIVALLSLGNFSLIYIMTQGGPGNATNILPVYSYQEAFTFYNLAYGALIGDVLVILATVAAFFYVRVSRVQI